MGAKIAVIIYRTNEWLEFPGNKKRLNSLKPASFKSIYILFQFLVKMNELAGHEPSSTEIMKFIVYIPSHVLNVPVPS